VADAVTTLPDAVDTAWANPIVALYQEQSEYITILDDLAVQYGIGNPSGSFAEAPLPSQVVYELCAVDPVAIQTTALRLHRATEERFATLSDADFEDLLEDSWRGDLADLFRQWVEGGGTYQGINVFFEEVRAKAEGTALVLYNMAERLKDSLEELDNALREQFAGLDDVAARNGMAASGMWSYVLGAGGPIIGLLAPVSGVIVFILTVISLVIFLWDMHRKTAEDVEGSIEALGAFHGAVSSQTGSTGADGDALAQAEFEGADGDG
jgi:hypothetical protein